MSAQMPTKVLPVVQTDRCATQPPVAMQCRRTAVVAAAADCRPSRPPPPAPDTAHGPVLLQAVIKSSDMSEDMQGEVVTIAITVGGAEPG